MSRRDDEKDENKGLVWVGYPANYASRLTDVANKSFTDTFYYVTADFYHRNLAPMTSLGGKPDGWYRGTRKYTGEEISTHLIPGINQSVKFDFTNLVKFEKVDEKYKYPSILISDAIYQGFKKANPFDSSIRNNYWEQQYRPIKDIDYPVWGCSLVWNLK